MNFDYLWLVHIVVTVGISLSYWKKKTCLFLFFDYHTSQHTHTIIKIYYLFLQTVKLFCCFNEG